MKIEKEEGRLIKEYWDECLKELDENCLATIYWPNGKKRQSKMKYSDRFTGDLFVQTITFSEDGEVTGFFQLKNGALQ